MDVTQKILYKPSIETSTFLLSTLEVKAVDSGPQAHHQLRIVNLNLAWATQKSTECQVILEEAGQSLCPPPMAETSLIPHSL